MHALTLTAPSRLHFGLWAFGDTSLRQFGGVGLMIEEPALQIAVTKAPAFVAHGPQHQRVAEFARRWSASHGRPLPSCSLVVKRAIPAHAGLGSGTQLALGVATVLSAFVGLPNQSPPELARSVGRGLRSAVGTYGFAFGGLVVEQGKLVGEDISPLECRLDFPAPWRLVLLKPRGLAGLAGDDEYRAFASLPPIPRAVSEALVLEAMQRLVPAVAKADFAAFAASVSHYGHLAGQCFALRQGGPYNGPVVTELVECLRDLGNPGVGQSSWGPTVFAVTPTQAAADQLAEQIQSRFCEPLEITITKSANQGAQLLATSDDGEQWAA